MTMRGLKTHTLIGFLVVLSGCATSKPMYYWGEYEDLVYSMYVEPGEADPGTQVIKLTEDIQKAHDSGLNVPPGVHAHLGYMQYLQGNTSLGLHEFEVEKELYPESAIFIDGLLERLKK